ncbi:MAG: translation initiation factor IF-2, partial [Deltaproteobacteria bacterium]|nr:translation initiation factor IF-2 [Deltaproteobacteria bacterium]
MKKIRLYELARELNIDCKILVEKASSLGLKVKSHSSSLSEEEKNYLISVIGSDFTSTDRSGSSAMTGTSKDDEGLNIDVYRRTETINGSTIQVISSSGTIIRRRRVEGVENEKSQVSSIESQVELESVPVEGKSSDLSSQTISKSKQPESFIPGVDVASEVLVDEREKESVVIESDINLEQRKDESVNKPQIKVLGKIDVKSSSRQPGMGLQEFFDQNEKDTLVEPVKKVIRFKEAKSFAPQSPVQNPVRVSRTPERKVTVAKPKIAPAQKAREVKVEPILTVGEFAAALNVKSSEIIQKLLNYGEAKTINDIVDEDTMSVIAEDLGVKLIFQSLDETEVFPELFSTKGTEFYRRPPVITVMGHVDHGKTSLLDAIRESNVVSKEAGGITQHIGAYSVRQGERTITFIDTPGHEAFTEIRSRGARVTDIVVLVVAADDGVMPQTLEAVNHAKSANVPIIVAINKIDKVGANPDSIKTRLAEEGLIPDDWGGDTIYVPISALKKINLDKLLDSINLVSDLLNLDAPIDVPATCFVLESKQEKGRGWVATVIPEAGVLKVGDVFCCGAIVGKVKNITGPGGEVLSQLYPGFPAEISGFPEPPSVGDKLLVVQSESKAKELAEFRKRRNLRFQALKPSFSLADFSKLAKEDRAKELRLIVKADTQGSVEALNNSLGSLQFSEIGVKIIHSAVGSVTESDIKLAKAAEAVVIAFNTSVDTRAISEAESKGVEIRRYRIIYECLEDIKLALQGLLETETVLE